MPKPLTQTPGYKALVAKILKELNDLKRFVRDRTALSHWNMGRHIHVHILKQKDRADYGAMLFPQLEKDTGYDATTLQRCLQFYRAYPILADTRELSWEHYKSLITVEDPEERKKLEEKVVKGDWDTTRLRKHVSMKHKLDAPVSDDKPIPQLTCTRGQLHAYQIVPANQSLAPHGPLAIDLGFREQHVLPKKFHPLPKGEGMGEGSGNNTVKENDIVELIFRAGKLSTLRKSPTKPSDIFTYIAYVDKIIDGDTLLVSFDFQLETSVSQKLRLRGIDCPELDTEEGKRAKRFVESRLKDCPFIIVKTYKDRTDQWDRYVADIFYAPKLVPNDSGATMEPWTPERVAAEGIYLNQQLLDERLAVKWEN